MSLLEEAITQNNDAVDLLVAGKPEECVPLFMASLAAAKQQLESTIAHKDRIEACLADLPRQPAGRASCPYQDRHIRYVRRGSLPDTDEPFVFYGAFLLFQPKSLPTTWQHYQDMLNTNSACTIFNLGLAYQIIGTNSPSSAHLHKAEKMYEMAMRLLEDNCVLDYTTFSTQSTVAMLMLVACKNNLAEIQFRRGGDNEKARQNIQDLSLLLYQLTDETNSAPEAFSRRAMEGFISNVMFLQHPITFAPAA